MNFVIYIYLSLVFCSHLIADTYNQTATQIENKTVELDDDITLEKKSLMILTAAYDEDQEMAERVLSIISDQATSIGRFEIIDRNLVDEILEEQKFQLSGMVDNDQVVEIGELAAAESAIILDIVNFGQKGVPKKDYDDDDDDDDRNETLFTWLVKTCLLYTSPSPRD